MLFMIRFMRPKVKDLANLKTMVVLGSGQSNRMEGRGGSLGRQLAGG